MKGILLTILILLIVQLGHAQWASNGNNAYFNSTGNVGIGITNPQYKLHVIGDIGLNQPYAFKFANGQEIRDNGNGGLSIYSANSINNVVSGGGAYTVNGGNMGIGTNPLYKLDLFNGTTGSGLNITGVAVGTRNDAGIEFSAANSTIVNYARIGLQITSGSLGDETGGLTFFTKNHGQLSEKMFIKSDGNVGVNSINPAYKLDVFNPTPGSTLNLTGAAIGTRNDAGIDFSAINGTIVNYARIGLQITTGTAGSETGGLTFYTKNAGVLSEKMFIKSDGNVGIGTTNPDQKLSVAGTIHSQVVKVDMTGWSDYVFKSAYNLSSLESIKIYIDKNHHLPDMPSEKEVIKNGLDLGEMLKLQQKKIEELTLYLIEKDKQLSSYENRLKQLERKLKYH